MVAEWAGALAKVAGPTAGRLVAKPLQGLALTWVVAYKARRQAKKDGVGLLPYWRLRKFLSTGEALDAFKSGDPQRYEEVGRGLAAICQSPDSVCDGAEAKLAVLLLRAYTTSLDPNTNVEMYSAITAERVGSQLELRESKRYAGDAMFERNLERIPPHRAEEARELRATWPAVSQFVHEFVHSSDRSSTLTSWHHKPPTWFQTRPSHAVAWFANLANDYGLREIASAAFDDAIDAGATPQAHWRTRQILTASQDVAELAELLAPHEGESPLAHALVVAHADSYAQAAINLRQWEPQSASDNAAKVSLLAQLIASDDIAEAIKLSELGFTLYQSAACGSLLARFLITRGLPRRTTLDFADLERALEAALKARDAIRAWDGPSEGAVEIAIVAARLLGRVHQAWSLARTPPEGIATRREAADSGVRREAATMAAQTKTPELARELARDTGAMTEHEVEAIIALFNRDDDVALAQFQAAIDHAIEHQHVEQLSLQIALLGTRSSKIEQLDPDRKYELGLIADARNGSEEAISVLRARARSSCRDLAGC